MLFVCLAAAVFGAVEPRSVWDGVYTESQAQRGQALFRARCAGCHGADLAGAKDAPGLTGAKFWTAWNDLPASYLFERIRQTMPDDNPGSLTPAQNADLLAYLLSVNRFPPGARDLDRELEALQRIRIEEKKSR
jgi:mono/diheme cytochrome c family protein